MTTRPDGPGPVGRLTAAEDHLQETFLRAGSWLQEHSADLATRRPWLLTVARRIVLDPCPQPAAPADRRHRRGRDPASRDRQ